MKQNHKWWQCQIFGRIRRFKDGIPFGIVNKTKTDVGGTYVAANCSSNYIVDMCPFKDLVDSIAADKNNRYEVFKCYGGVKEYQFRKYIKNNTTYKIAVTYDSLPKLNWMVEQYKVESLGRWIPFNLGEHGFQIWCN